MTTASVAPEKISMVSARALTAPKVRDPRTTRVRGQEPVLRSAVRSAMRVWGAWIVMAASLSQWCGVALHPSVYLMSLAQPGQMAGIAGQPRFSWASSPREVTPALAKTLRRWNATVRGETQH